MNFKSWFKEHSIFIGLYSLIIFIVTMLLFRLHLTSEDIVYLFTLLFSPIVLYSLWRYYKKNRYYHEINRLLGELDQKYLLSEVLPSATFLEAKYLNDIIDEMTSTFNQVLSQERQKQREYYEYIQLWIHEIKLPLSSLDLMIENRNYNQQQLRLIERKMEHLIQQVLFYAKSNQVNMDYHIRLQSSYDIIQTVIANQSLDLIASKFLLNLPKEDVQVYSDRQWLSFIVGQVISNSIKYKTTSESPTLSIQFVDTDNEVQWVIEDNGQGILEKDLPHVFDKGYTGIQGRNGQKATGMGLYICKKLCEQLNIRIEIQSVYGQFTRVILYFPKSKNIFIQK